MHVTLSVIIPVFNGAKFIAKTVQTALDQTYENYEVIVVNDGSTDETLAKLTPFLDSIRVISIPNGGVSNARNTGILASIGEYVAFLDADDLWYPEKLKQQIEAMKANPGVGLCFCNYATRSQLGHKTVHFDQFKDNKKLKLNCTMAESSFEELIKGNFVGTCSNVIVRRDVLDRTGLFDTRLRQAEDYELWIRCALDTKFLSMSKVLLTKTTHETNLTNNLTETWQCHERVLEMLLQGEITKTRAHLIPLVKKELAKVRYLIGNRLFHHDELSKCFYYFHAGLRSDWSLTNFYTFWFHASRKLGRLVLQTLHLRRPFHED